MNGKISCRLSHSSHSPFRHRFSTKSLSAAAGAKLTNLCSRGHVKEAFTKFTSLIWSQPALFSHLLKSCIQTRSLSLSKQIHSLIVTSGCFRDKFVRNHLLNAYAKLGQMEAAALVFDAMPKRNTMTYNILIGGFVQKGDLETASKLFNELGERNLASWNAMIVGFVQHEFNEDGLDLFSQMHKLWFSPDVFTLGSVFRGCAGLQDLNRGRQVHAYAVKSGLECHLIVGGSLAHMYMRSGSLREGEMVIRMMPVFSVATFNTLISGKAKNGCSEGAMDIYSVMKRAGFKPDKITFVSVHSHSPF